MPDSTHAETTQSDLNKIADEITGLWVEDELIDGLSLPDHLQRKTGNYKEVAKAASWDDWDGLGGVDNPSIGKPADLLNDPEVMEELARRDPEFKAKLDAQKMEQTSLDFTRQNPEYLATPANLSTMLKYIAKKHLDAPNLDEDDVIPEAYKLGFWTVATLTDVFKTLQRQGKLEVEFGKTKPLTRQDQLEVVAQIRAGDLEGACLTYIYRAYGSSVPEFSSPSDFLVKNSALASEAAKFVFFNSKATISHDDWKEFEKQKLARRPMLTFELISDAWDEWRNSASRIFAPSLKPAQEPPPEPVPLTRTELEDLPDEEIEALRIKALREIYRR